MKNKLLLGGVHKLNSAITWIITQECHSPLNPAGNPDIHRKGMKIFHFFAVLCHGRLGRSGGAAPCPDNPRLVPPGREFLQIRQSTRKMGHKDAWQGSRRSSSLSIQREIPAASAFPKKIQEFRQLWLQGNPFLAPARNSQEPNWILNSNSTGSEVFRARKALGSCPVHGGRPWRLIMSFQGVNNGPSRG